MNTYPTCQPQGESIGNVPPLFQLIKTNVHAYVHAYSETDHSPLFKTLHRSSSKINIRVITVTTKYNNINVGDGLHRPL